MTPYEENLIKWMKMQIRIIRFMYTFDMIVIWDNETVDIIPDPWKYEDLKREMDSLITLN